MWTPTLGDDTRSRIALGVLLVDGVTVTEGDPVFGEELEAVGRAHRASGATSSGDVPGVGLARRFYKAIGVDPTKTRPSSEALLRRALKSEPLPRVNSLVDVVNASSLESLLPFGLYDRAALAPPLVARTGGPGEGYEGIRKGRVNLEGRLLLADSQGPFGNPTSDSDRTKVTTATRDALIVVFAPAGEAAAIERALSLTRARLARTGQGRVS